MAEQLSFGSCGNSDDKGQCKARPVKLFLVLRKGADEKGVVRLKGGPRARRPWAPARAPRFSDTGWDGCSFMWSLICSDKAGRAGYAEHRSNPVACMSDKSAGYPDAWLPAGLKLPVSSMSTCRARQSINLSNTKALNSNDKHELTK
jgi:hypothetical protein